VFVTFETEEGYRRACKYNDLVNKDSDIATENMVKFDKFLGKPIDLQEASEPSDIIWENREYSERERNFKRVISFLIIFSMLVASAAIIYFCSIKSLQLKTKYPHLECFGNEGFINREYGSDDENAEIDYTSLE
jgi:hypothetical protein